MKSEFMNYKIKKENRKKIQKIKKTIQHGREEINNMRKLRTETNPQVFRLKRVTERHAK